MDTPQNIPANAGWYWLSDPDGSLWTGPHATREAAIAEAVASGNPDPEGNYEICMAAADPIGLAQFVDADLIYATMRETYAQSSYAFGDDPGLPEMTEDQRDDLDARLMEAVSAWQAAHGIVMIPCKFSWRSDAEIIPAPTTGAES